MWASPGKAGIHFCPRYWYCFEVCQSHIVHTGIHVNIKLLSFRYQRTVLYNCFSYQELYQSCVTKLTKPECIYTQSRGGEEEPKVDNNKSLNSSTRKLPSWMLGKEEATPTKLSLDRTDSSSSTDGLGRYTQRVYWNNVWMERGGP